ncbi:MAG: SIMPL domain-containing protein, partial [Verrucomicrobia bacterium]|nr:SIMPL domain-containing protein [Verrucomicrobiota bacterium]
LILLTCSSCWAAAPFFPKLVVSGSALLHKPADQFGLSISVISQAETAEQALADNNERIYNVVNSLHIAGLEKGEYHTGQFSIQPIYSGAPRDIPPDWKPTIIAYEVNNSVTIHTQKLDLAPTIIDAAGKAGASQIANICFSIKEPAMYRTEAISQATANAIKDAETLASAANLTIVRVLDITLDQPQIYGRAGQNMLFMAKADRAPFIEAPDVDISANVSVTFEIASRS